MAVRLLSSKATSDILEALDFLAVAVEFGVPGAEAGVRQGLVLVWSQDQGTVDAVISVYNRLFLSALGGEEGKSEKEVVLKTAAVVRNLLSLVSQSSAGEILSLEELVRHLVEKDLFPTQVVCMLWNVVTRQFPGSTPKDVRNAMHILSMAAGAKPEIVGANMDTILAHGLGAAGGNGCDLILAKLTCCSLQRIAKRKKGEKFSHFPVSLQLFKRMTLLLEEEITNENTSNWCPFAEQAILAIYKLSEHPDQLCGALLKALKCRVLRGEEESFDSEEPIATSTQGMSTIAKLRPIIIIECVCVCVCVQTLTLMLVPVPDLKASQSTPYSCLGCCLRWGKWHSAKWCTWKQPSLMS